jgi:ribose transport system substrate-binding protein
VQKKQNALLTVAAAATLLAALTGCSQDSTTPATSADDAAGTTSAAADNGGEIPTVCLVVKSLANEYFQEMFKGAEEHETELGTFKLDAQGIQNETDVDGQIALVDSCITKGGDALVIAPADSKALIPAAKKAAEAGLVVVNIDVPFDEAGLADVGLDLPFVGPDNTLGAQEVGKLLADDLGDGGKVVILEGNPGAENAAQRKAGFEEAIAAGNLDLIDSKTAHWETDEANTVFASMLTANPDIQGVFASNDSMALGVLKVIESQNADIKVVSIDNIPAIRQYLGAGVLLATLDQFGSSQANFGIDTAMDILGGETITGWQTTDLEVVTSAN